MKSNNPTDTFNLQVEFVLITMTALSVLGKPLMPLKQTVVIFSVVNVSFLTMYELIKYFHEFRIYEFLNLRVTNCLVVKNEHLCYLALFFYFENFRLIEKQNEENFVKKKSLIRSFRIRENM